jgi:hypothetical protein
MHPAAAKAIFDDQISTLSPALAARRRWTFHSLEHPVIDCSFAMDARTSLRLRLMCDDWNDKPPSVTLHALDGSMLSTPPVNPTGVFHPQPHPSTGRLFICMRGTREYHTHPSHVGDPWEAVKDSSSYTLGGILTQVWSAWQKGSG